MIIDSKNRYAYPFVTADGKTSPLTEAVSDMVLNVSTTCSLPILVNSYVKEDMLTISFTDATEANVVYAVEGSSIIRDINGTANGIIVWDKYKAKVLKSILKANDPQPWSNTYVIPDLCLPRGPIPLSVVYINGEIVQEDNIVIDYIPINGLSKTPDTSILNIYADIKDNTPLSCIRIDNGETTYDISGHKKHIWLKSDAECDLRVVTSGAIHLTEVTNDKY